MSDTRQFVACKFRSTDTRSFTYHYDGAEPLTVGDLVKVPDRSGDGWKRVEVVSITDEAPSFPTKEILGLYNTDLEDVPGAEQPAVDPIDSDKILF